MGETLEARKTRLRKEMRNLVRALDPPTGPERLLEIVLLGLSEQRQWGPNLVLTLPLEGEVDLSGFAREWLGQGSRVLMPRVVEPDKPMEIREIRALEGVQPGWKGTPEPPATGPLVAPDAVDVFLVPGVAFDRCGRRLGRGGGHFDRLLALRRPDAELWGVCHPEQILDEVPACDHDIMVQGIVTRRGWYLCPGS